MLAYHNDPFDWLVGPTTTLYADELLSASTSFYRELRHHGDSAAALTAIADERFRQFERGAGGWTTTSLADYGRLRVRRRGHSSLLRIAKTRLR
jgi:hypothetical protein